MLRYANLSVDTVNHEILYLGDKVDAAESIVRTQPWGYEVVDSRGQTTDKVVVERDKVIDWTTYKEIGPVREGMIVLEQRYQPQYPEGNPWDDFEISRGHGEIGFVMIGEGAGGTVAKMHVIYVYENASVLIASYCSAGKLERISAHDGSVGTYYIPELRLRNPFASYGLPETTRSGEDSITLNDVIVAGLGSITSYEYAPGALEGVVLVRTYENGVVNVVRFGADGGLLEKRIVKFTERPYDLKR